MTNKDFIVTDNAIDMAIERIEGMEDSDLLEMFERLSKEQPQMMGYVVGLGEGLENEQAEEDLLYLTMVVWQASELARNGSIPSITEESINSVDKKTDELYELIMSFPPAAEEDEINALIDGSRQPAIVSYLADEFFSDEYIDLEEEKVAKMFACMTVIGEALAAA